MARKTGSHAEITGPRIREAALELFAKHGYAAVSMRQIAAKVGVQAGALYTYTAHKQSLLFDLMQSHMEHLLQSLDAVETPADDPLAALEAFARFHIRYHLDRPTEVFISYMELRNLEPENFRVIVGLRGVYERRLEAILVAGRDSGAFRLADSKVATMGIIAMLTGVSTWYRDGGRLSRAEVEEVYWDLTRRAVGVGGDAAGQSDGASDPAAMLSARAG